MAKYTTDELLKLAESHYLKNEYDDALKLFIENKDLIDSPSLWHFNVGTLYLKKDSYGLARYHLEKAKNSLDLGRLAERNIDSILSNDFVIDVSKSTKINEKFVSFGVTSSIWEYSLIFLLLIIINLLMYRFKKITKSLFLVGLIICTLPFAGFYFFKTNYKSAVVINDVALREGPSEIYEENMIVPAGSKIIYSMTKNGWFLVDFPEDVRGWLDGKSIRAIGN
jgi:hypothetical protein